MADGGSPRPLTDFTTLLSACHLSPLHMRARSHTQWNTGDQSIFLGSTVKVDFDLVFVDCQVFCNDLDDLIAQLLDGALGQAAAVVRQSQFQTLLRSIFTLLPISPRREMFDELV